MERSGFISVPGGRVWFRVLGTGDATPLLVLHGGPGASSRPYGNLSALADERPVVFYDQLGGGRSDRPDDRQLWQTARFVEELIEVRRALGLDEIHLFGHSWGAMLGLEHVLGGAPGIQSLTLASPVVETARFIQDTDRLRAALPIDVREALDAHEAAGTTDSPEYARATFEFYRRHLSRCDPWPGELDGSDLGLDVYHTMWGPTDFFVTGSLRSYNRTADLSKLSGPVLFTAGRYDEATPETTAFYCSKVAGARIEIFEHSAHTTNLDEPEAYLEVLRQFLRDSESAA